MKLNHIYHGDVMDVLGDLPSESIQCCVTSPPYWGLRDYGVAGQIGLEATPEEYIEKMVMVFRHVKRTLRKDGTLWLNIGDCYAHNGSAYGNEKSTLNGRRHGLEMGLKRKVKKGPGLKRKDLVGVPWMLAFALRADGWYLRSDIIWHKPNPMPGSAKDRPTSSHEHIFLLAKRARYFYDAYAIKTPLRPKTLTTFGTTQKGYGDNTGLVQSENWGNSVKVRKPRTWKTPDGWDTEKGTHGAFHRNGRGNGEKIDKQRGHGRTHAGFNDRWDAMTKEEQQSMGANKRDVWTVATRPYKEAHFATFPEALIVDCIRAGSRPGDIVLDPFFGAGTTGLVAAKQGRKFVGIELNPEYIKIADQRLKRELGMFYEEGAA